MKKLNLPIPKKPFPEGKSLSMDEYVEFVNFNLKLTFDKKNRKPNRELPIVPIPFAIKWPNPGNREEYYKLQENMEQLAKKNHSGYHGQGFRNTPRFDVQCSSPLA
jgi:hypothetical protein